MPLIYRIGVVSPQDVHTALLKTFTENCLHQTVNRFAYQQIAEDSIQFVGVSENEVPLNVAALYGLWIDKQRIRLLTQCLHFVGFKYPRNQRKSVLPEIADDFSGPFFTERLSFVDWC